MYARTPTINVSNTVVRTIVYKVVEDLKHNLSMDANAFISLENLYEDKIIDTGINRSSGKNELETPITERIKVTASKPKVAEYHVGNIINDRKEFFRTKDIVISTDFVSHELEISIAYETKSKVNADTFVNRLKDIAITSTLGYTHEASYYYLMPPEVLGLLEDIYTTGQINIPTPNHSFIDYLYTGNKLNSVTLTSDINGYVGDLGLAVLATNKIVGTFEIDIKNIENELDQSTNVWNIPVTYKINYVSPESFITDFNLLVNNNMLPDKYYLERTRHSPDPYRNKDNKLYMSNLVVEEYKLEYVCIPPYDNHKVKVHNNKFIKPILSVLTGITADDRKSLFNLKDLHFYTIKDEYIEYMKANYSSLCGRLKLGFDSLFVLDLYVNNKLTNRSNITVDEDLNVSSVVDLDLANTHRVVLSIVVDTELLSTVGKSSVSTIDVKEVYNILTGTSTDFRVADQAVRYMIPIKDASTALTAQTSIIQTFFK